MAYLGNSEERTVTAIITRKGREKLSQRGIFRITKFALGDDEIDYSLWNENHPLGSDYYGSIIENMPLLEPISNEALALRYKLVTLPKQTVKMPIITVGTPSITLERYGDEAVITPNTFNGNNDRLGYTATLHNINAANLLVAQPAPGAGGMQGRTALLDEDINITTSVIGLSFIVRAKRVNQDITTQITIVGNETGGSTTITLVVRKNDVYYTTE